MSWSGVPETMRIGRPLRLRIVLEPEFGPAWLSLLCLCAWLRGGIIGERVAEP